MPLPPAEAPVPPDTSIVLPTDPAWQGPRDIWAQNERLRGRENQDFLAHTDYQGYIETDKLQKFERARNFPLIDFVSPDGTVSVSVKTYNPFSDSFARGDTLQDLVDHARELAGHAPGQLSLIHI